MLAVFLKTLPFFGIIALGFLAARRGTFGEEATAYLTKFVFYFALSAMLFRFSATLTLGEVLNWSLVFAYLAASLAVYLLASGFAFARHRDMAETAIEAQCATIGNVGFLGIPMLALLLGEAAIGPIMLVLAVDLIVFGSIIVVLVTLAQGTARGLSILRSVFLGLITHPMIVSISLGLLWSAAGAPIPAPALEFLTLLGGAATPCALFAIGASLAFKSTERMEVAVRLSALKLIAHPVFVALACFLVFDVAPFAASVAIAAAALPTAGNVYILAQHYGVAPQRASATILVSTAVSVLTIPIVIALING